MPVSKDLHQQLPGNYICVLLAVPTLYCFAGLHRLLAYVMYRAISPTASAQKKTKKKKDQP